MLLSMNLCYNTVNLLYNDSVCPQIIIAPLWKSGGYIGYSVRPSDRHNFVSAQCFEKNFKESNQILYVHLNWYDLPWDCYTSFFEHLYQSYGPWLCRNSVPAQYLENQLVEFHQILYMHSSLQDLACDCYTSFLANLYGVMALDLCRNFVSAQYLDNLPTFFHQILKG